MNGPGTQRLETVAGTRYLLVTTCKDHDCGDNIWDRTIEFVAEHDDSDKRHMERI